MISLKELREQKNVPARDIVEVVKGIYPKYDKTIQSKCENGKVYGVCLRKDALDAVFEKFAPELKKKQRKDTHRLTCRISCRLENADYEQLQRHIKEDGYDTMQDWLTGIVKNYNRRKECI